jgi:phage protein U
VARDLRHAADGTGKTLVWLPVVGARGASFALSIFDTEQRYRHLNTTAGEVMGLDEAVLRGQVFPYGVPPDVSRQGTLQALRDVAETGKPVH